jgi:lipid-binding SYLF domain-containing protein
MKTAAMIATICVVFGALLAPSLAGSSDKNTMKARHKVEEIDLLAKNTLEQLFEKSAPAKELFEKSYGYAVFDNLKLAFGVSGGGGSGVAVEKESGKRTYMKMGTGGIGFGLGGQKYQVVFLFQAKKPFDNFVEKGWKADAAANVAVVNEGASVQAGFVNGLAVYQLTDKGLMLQADISGSKYWKDEKLTEQAAEMKGESGVQPEETQEKPEKSHDTDDEKDKDEE